MAGPGHNANSTAPSPMGNRGGNVADTTTTPTPDRQHCYQRALTQAVADFAAVVYPPCVHGPDAIAMPLSPRAPG